MGFLGGLLVRWRRLGGILHLRDGVLRLTSSTGIQLYSLVTVVACHGSNKVKTAWGKHVLRKRILNNKKENNEKVKTSLYEVGILCVD